MTQVRRPEQTLIDQPLGTNTTALLGQRQGKYPDANGLLVRGTDRTALIEPTPGVWQRLDGGLLRLEAPRDLVLLSHAHEDHVTGLELLPDLDVWVHELDREAMTSLDAFIDQYGLPEEVAREFRDQVVDQFRFVPRPDARTYADGHEWDLGSGVRIQAIHAPGHTPGHCFFWIEPDAVLYLGDLDLSSFGPFYGDRHSSLDAFVRTIERARQLAEDLRPRWFVSGHHKGVVSAADFPQQLQRYEAAIVRRDERVLELLADGPAGRDQIAARRIIYRPENEGLFIEHVERVSTGMHLTRLERAGRVRPLDDGRWERL